VSEIQAVFSVCCSIVSSRNQSPAYGGEALALGEELPNQPVRILVHSAAHPGNPPNFSGGQ